jgi:hypothetical protein
MSRKLRVLESFKSKYIHPLQMQLKRVSNAGPREPPKVSVM